MPVLLAEYMRRQVVRDRNLSALIAWASYTISQPVPGSKPEDDWVRLRLVAERIPAQPQQYTERTIGYFMGDPTTVTNLRAYLSDTNTDAEEASLADQLSGIIAAFMPSFARIDVVDGQIQQWLTQHGWPPETPVETGPEPRSRRPAS